MARTSYTKYVELLVLRHEVAVLLRTVASGELEKAKSLASVLAESDAGSTKTPIALARVLTAAGNVAQAVELARRKSKIYRRANLMRPISATLAAAGDVERAEQLVATGEDADDRAKAQAAIALALCGGSRPDPERARHIVASRLTTGQMQAALRVLPELDPSAIAAAADIALDIAASNDHTPGP
jgi:hypothetical protein